MKTLLKNGTIVDGSGGKPYVSDVLIENDKITKIAKDIDAADAEVIDCTGLTVAPGFIDAHSHNDFFYDYDDAERFYEPFIRQGITTQITGNCGFSPFGVDKNTKYKDKVGGGLFHAKNPGSFKDFVKNAEGKLYVNIVPLIGHGTTRISISGFDAKPLTKEQIDEEMKLVDEAMENGAFGGSFGFMYEPGMYSKTDELVAFAKELQKYLIFTPDHSPARGVESRDGLSPYLETAYRNRAGRNHRHYGKVESQDGIQPSYFRRSFVVAER